MSQKTGISIRIPHESHRMLVAFVERNPMYKIGHFAGKAIEDAIVNKEHLSIILTGEAIATAINRAEERSKRNT